MGTYIFHRDGFFRSATRHTEADLVLPKNGEARCYIAAADVEMDPIPFTCWRDVAFVVRAEMDATGAHLPFGALVDYYATETWENCTNKVSAIKKSIREAEARGDGIDVFSLLAA